MIIATLTGRGITRDDFDPRMVLGLLAASDAGLKAEAMRVLEEACHRLIRFERLLEWVNAAGKKLGEARP